MTRRDYFVQCGSKTDQLPKKMLYQSDIRGEACGKEAVSEPAEPVAQGGDAACELIRGVPVPPKSHLSLGWEFTAREKLQELQAACLSRFFPKNTAIPSCALPAAVTPTSALCQGSPPQL